MPDDVVIAISVSFQMDVCWMWSEPADARWMNLRFDARDGSEGRAERVARMVASLNSSMLWSVDCWA